MRQFFGIVHTLVFLGMFVFSCAMIHADAVVLRDGGEIKGKITKRTEDAITIEIGGMALDIKMGKIQSINGKRVASGGKEVDTGDQKTSGSMPTKDLRCEWQKGGATVADRCPEFYWELGDQTAYQIVVYDSPSRKNKLWDSGKVETPLTIAEYDGKPLESGKQYVWKLRVKTEGKGWSRFSALQKFRTLFAPMPHVRPHIRTFVNFGGNSIKDRKFLTDNYDLTWSTIAGMHPGDKKLNPKFIGTRYVQVSAITEGSEKWTDMESLCQREKIEMEEIFLHYAEDTARKLRVGEWNKLKQGTRTVPGWDPHNDRNKDGRVDDKEFRNLVNPKATARSKKEARVPCSHWDSKGRQHYYTNMNNPAVRRLLAECHAKALMGTDGLVIDWCTPYAMGLSPTVKLLEYPQENAEERQAAYLRDFQATLARLKMTIGADHLLIGNGWTGWGTNLIPNPFVLDGCQWEGGFSIHEGLEIESRLQLVTKLNQRGKIQLIKYGYFDERSPLRRGKIEKDRDLLFGLAVYYLIQGDYTYLYIGPTMMGAGYLGTERSADGTSWHEKYCLFEAMNYDIGKPLSPYYEFDREELAAPMGKIVWKILARKYERALVLVKLANDVGDAKTATEHKLDGTYRPLRLDGTLGPATDKARLRQSEAAILVKSEKKR